MPRPELAGGDGCTVPDCHEKVRSEGLRLFLVGQIGGRGWVRQPQWEESLETGDLAVCAGSPPLCRVEGSGRQFLFSLVLNGREDVCSFLPLRLSAENPATRLLLRAAESLAPACEELAPPLAEKFHAGLLAMVEATVEYARPAAERGLSRLTVYHLERIKSFLRRHLREPNLRVSDVAKALEISVSHLHRLFVHEDCTVAEWLWAERLKNFAQELLAPGHAHQGVGEIALNWGFNDLSHFSRAFKKRFGVSPRDWRSQAAWRAPLHK